MFYILPTLQVGQPLRNYCGQKRLYHLKYGLFGDTGAPGQVRTCDSPLNTAVSTQLLLEKTAMQVIKRKQSGSVWGCEPPLPSGLSKALVRLAMTRMTTLPWVTTFPPLMERGAKYRFIQQLLGFPRRVPIHPPTAPPELYGRATPDEASAQGELVAGLCVNALGCHPTPQKAFWFSSMGVNSQDSMVARYEMEHCFTLALHRVKHQEQPGDSWSIGSVTGFKVGRFFS